MPERPHLAYPVQLSPGGSLFAVEQGSDREVADCIAVILSWPVGTREGLPRFGVDPQLFESGGPDLVALDAAIDVSEPRAVGLRDTILNATLKGSVAQVLVGFDTATNPQ